MSGLICPICKSTLQEQNREGVSIDVCPQCRGVWLDRGELEKLMSVVRNDYASLPPQQQARPQPRGDYDDDDNHYRDATRPRHRDDDYHHRDHRGYPPRKKSKMETIFDIFD